MRRLLTVDPSVSNGRIRDRAAYSPAALLHYIPHATVRRQVCGWTCSGWRVTVEQVMCVVRPC